MLRRTESIKSQSLPQSQRQQRKVSAVSDRSDTSERADIRYYHIQFVVVYSIMFVQVVVPVQT